MLANLISWRPDSDSSGLPEAQSDFDEIVRGEAGKEVRVEEARSSVQCCDIEI